MVWKSQQVHSAISISKINFILIFRRLGDISESFLLYVALISSDNSSDLICVSDSLGCDRQLQSTVCYLLVLF